VQGDRGVSNVYLFGSAARGDVDCASDTDLLIVYDERPSECVKAHARSCLRRAFGKNCSFAEYSRRRLAELFNEGHLFAWHLFYEGKVVQVPQLCMTGSFVATRPMPYIAGMRDAERFSRLLRSTVDRLSDHGSSPVYEAGIAYVALRNIGMSLSSALFERPNFTRWAPFRVSDVLLGSTPLSRSQYNRMIAARHVSQRGGNAPGFERPTLLEELKCAHYWAASLVEAAREHHFS